MKCKKKETNLCFYLPVAGHAVNTLHLSTTQRGEMEINGVWEKKMDDVSTAH